MLSLHTIPIFKTRCTINGIELTDEDKNNILDYLRVNGIPIINKTYMFAREKYMKGEITPEMIETRKHELSSKEEKEINTIIPSM